MIWLKDSFVREFSKKALAFGGVAGISILAFAIGVRYGAWLFTDVMYEVCKVSLENHRDW